MSSWGDVKIVRKRLQIREFELHSRHLVKFRTNTLEKAMNPLFFQLWETYYNYYFSPRMTLELNPQIKLNPQMLNAFKQPY